VKEKRGKTKEKLIIRKKSKMGKNKEKKLEGDGKY
jgi:hypothetical protein